MKIVRKSCVVVTDVQRRHRSQADAGETRLVAGYPLSRAEERGCCGLSQLAEGAQGFKSGRSSYSRLHVIPPRSRSCTAMSIGLGKGSSGTIKNGKPVPVEN